VASATVTRDSVGAAGVAGLGAVALLLTAPPGVDLAAHVYQQAVFLHHGFSLWTNFWYGGRYTFVGYSILYYPLASLVGMNALAVVSAAGAAFGFTALVVTTWGDKGRLAAWTFALLWPATLLGAAFPFALGVAFASLAAAALARGRRWSFTALALLAFLTSPLALLILIMVLAGMAVAARRDWRRFTVPVAVIGIAGCAELLTMRVFPTSDTYPFPLADLGATLTFTGLGLATTWRVEAARPLRAFFAIYGVVVVVAFVVPSTLGSNVDRVRYAALPLALLTSMLRHWRPKALVVPALVLAATWNLTPTLGAVTRTPQDASPAYWAPAVAYLRAHLTPAYRVEVVDTADHWEAAYLPDAGIPIVRGWFRQDDFPQNTVLYNDEALTPRAYRGWLRSVGARYVVLSDASPDYSARTEAALVGGGRSGLHLVWRAAHLRIYALPHPTGILRGPGTVTRLGQSSLHLSLRRAGTYRIALHWSPYLHTSNGCITRSRAGTVVLAAARPGPARIWFGVNITRGIATLVGSRPPACS
jgi:hypothetical protein